MAASIEFELSGIKDEKLRDVLQSVRDFLRDFPLFNGDWKFFELSFVGPVDEMKIPHGLKFKPIDVLETAIIGEASVIWNYSLFDSTNLNVTVSSACTVRAFIGRHEKGNR